LVGSGSQGLKWSKSQTQQFDLKSSKTVSMQKAEKVQNAL